jgi:hypothetical protein
LGARFDFRVLAWFSFGVHADAFTLRDTWSNDAPRSDVGPRSSLSVSRSLNAVAPTIDARIHWLYEGNHDVSTSVGFGYVVANVAGQTREQRVMSGAVFGDADAAAQRWSRVSYGPLGRAALTWLWRSPVWLQTGLELSLDYWAESSKGRCGDALGSGCGSGFLRADNMAWSLAILAQLPVGKPL